MNDPAWAETDAYVEPMTPAMQEAWDAIAWRYKTSEAAKPGETTS
jgi:hypothetical protein